MGNDSSKGPPPSKVFGRSLKELHEHYREVFPPLRICLEFLSQDAALQQPNLFFKARSELELKELEDYFNAQTDRPNILTLSTMSVHTVAGFVKEFFERLPEPLLTFDRFEQLTQAMDRLEDVYHACSLQPDFYDRLFFIQSLVHTLPKAHYIVLERTIRLFAALAKNGSSNFISAGRLGVIFGSCFLRPAPPVSAARDGTKQEKDKEEDAESKRSVAAQEDKHADSVSGRQEAAQGPMSPDAGAAALGLHGAGAHSRRGGGWHVDRMAEDERAQNCVAFLIENYSEIFSLNPVRELKLMAKHYASMKEVYTAREDQLKQSEERQLRVKVKAAEVAFARRIAMRHFMAWQSIVRIKKEQTAADTVHVLRSQLIRANSTSKSSREKENQLLDIDARSDSSSEYTEVVKRSLPSQQNERRTKLLHS